MSLSSTSMAMTGLFSTRSGSRLGVSPQWYTSLASPSSSASTCCCCTGTSGPRNALPISSRTSAPLRLSAHIEWSHSREKEPSGCGYSQSASSSRESSIGGGGRSSGGPSRSRLSLSSSSSPSPPAEPELDAAPSPPAAGSACCPCAPVSGGTTLHVSPSGTSGLMPTRTTSGTRASRSAYVALSASRSGSGGGGTAPAPHAAQSSAGERWGSSLGGVAESSAQSRCLS
mmetsp:Transcript_8952/g.28325  ORF Transcript_8952/g.28325 Transcript_8952/m.28325 type:complete len:229 (-) Transcript_8952:461-1147(-)